MKVAMVVVDDKSPKDKVQNLQEGHAEKTEGHSCKITYTQVALGTVWPRGFLFEGPKTEETEGGRRS